MSRLAGKRALVTGAASGIGRATALRFLREGARVAALDVDAAGLRDLAGEAAGPRDPVGGAAGPRDPAAGAAGPRDGAAGPGSGADVTTVVADLGDEASVAAAFDRVGPLDIVVANAAVQLFGRDAPVHELDAAAFDQTVRVNLRGAFLTCKYGVRALLAAGGGSLIVTGSPTGLVGCAPGFTAYSASKAGAMGLARVVAADYARRGIRANVVVPGFTATPLVTSILDDDAEREKLLATVPAGRPGTPEDAAAVMVFLASDESGYVTGAVYTVDGGLTAV